jgi:hypothetical protein
MKFTKILGVGVKPVSKTASAVRLLFFKFVLKYISKKEKKRFMIIQKNC